MATHKHGRGTPVIKSESEQEKSYEEAKDYSIKERASADSVASMKDQAESFTPTNFSIKSEFEREQDNISGKYFSMDYILYHLNFDINNFRLTSYNLQPNY